MHKVVRTNEHIKKEAVNTNLNFNPIMGSIHLNFSEGKRLKIGDCVLLLQTCSS